MPPADDQPSELDRAVLLHHCGGDEPLAEDILRLMLGQVRMGLAALEGGEPDRGMAIAHGLKGSARSCGALRLARVAAAMERDPTEEAAAALAEALRSLEALLCGSERVDGTGG